MKESPTTKKWAAQLSSGFDELLGFASTELDRSKRKSTDSWRGYPEPPPLTKQRPLTENGPHSEVAANGPMPKVAPEGLVSGGGPAANKSQRSRSSSSESSRSSKRDKGGSGELSHSASRGSDLSRRSRSRSRSPRSPHREGGAPENAEDDIYKCFKKKFYGKLSSSGGGGANKSAEEPGSKYVHGKFRPKGKDWKKNMPGHEKSSDRNEASRDSSQAGGEGGKETPGGDGGPGDNSSQRPPSRPQSSSSHHSTSAFHATPGPPERASPSGGPRHSIHSPSPHARPASGTPLPRSTSPMSARSSGPPSRPGSDVGSTRGNEHPAALHSPFSRMSDAPARVPPLLAAGLLPMPPGMHGLDRLAAHMPLFADFRAHPGHAAAAAAFGLGPLLPPGIRPPLVGAEHLRPAVAVDGRPGGGDARGGHSFGGEPQIFNPLARHGKDALWND